MQERPDEEPGALSRGERRRRREAERTERAEEERGFLRAQLEPGEAIVSGSGWHPLITERRLLWARQLRIPPRRGEWVCDALSFSQINGWAKGNQHDGRPMIRLDHDPVSRIEHVPAHRFLWFRWGDAECPVPHITTTLRYRRGSDPDFILLRDALEARAILREPDFIERPAGTREERERARHEPMTPLRRWSPRGVGLRLHRWSTHLYQGQVAWPVRLVSWLILAVPAWILDPWLVLPAVALAEVGWIAFGQYRWKREQQRQRRFN